MLLVQGLHFENHCMDIQYPKSSTRNRKILQHCCSCGAGCSCNFVSIPGSENSICHGCSHTHTHTQEYKGPQVKAAVLGAHNWRGWKLEPRWQNRRIWAHLLPQKHQNHNWTATDKKYWKLLHKKTNKKRYSTSIDKKESTMRCQEGTFSYHQIPYLLDRQTINCKRSESSEPCVRLPSLEVKH